MTSLTLYHGTSHLRARSIKTSGFQQKAAKYLSYGEGAYFYRDFHGARAFADLEYKAEGCVIEVRVVVPKLRIRVFPYLELQNGPRYFNETATAENLLVIDASRDDGIMVVRPEAFSLIGVVNVQE
jgi:hypothetical protein